MRVWVCKLMLTLQLLNKEISGHKQTSVHQWRTGGRLHLLLADLSLLQVLLPHLCSLKEAVVFSISCNALCVGCWSGVVALSESCLLKYRNKHLCPPSDYTCLLCGPAKLRRRQPICIHSDVCIERAISWDMLKHSLWRFPDCNQVTSTCLLHLFAIAIGIPPKLRTCTYILQSAVIAPLLLLQVL